MLEQYIGLTGYLGATDRAILLANGSGGLTAQAAGLTVSANNCLTIPGATLTANEPLLNLSQTWNNAGVTFSGIKLNITDSASANASRLMSFAVGGAETLFFTKTFTPYGVTSGRPAIAFGTTSSDPVLQGAYQYYNGPALVVTDARFDGSAASANHGTIMVAPGSSAGCGLVGGYGVFLGDAAYIGWHNTAPDTGGRGDTRLYRDAANTLALRNSTNYQKLNVYNTYTSASVFERLRIGYNQSNEAELVTETTGGTARKLRIGVDGAEAIHFRTDSTDRWQLASAGHWVAYADNTYDIGFSGSQRPRTAYLGTSLNVASGTLTANTPLLDLSQTWNNAAVQFNALKIAITDTASDVSSTILSVQKSGAETFVIAARSSAGAYGTGVCCGINTDSSNGWFFNAGTGCFGANFELGWHSTGINYNSWSGRDLVLARDAANTLALRNGTNAQAFRVYNTWGSSGTNYERLSAYWSGNVCYIQTEAGGTGAARHLNIVSATGADLKLRAGNNLHFLTFDSVSRFYMTGVGNLIWTTDNTLDIGASGGHRPRTGYFGTSVIAPALKTNQGSTSTLAKAGGVLAGLPNVTAVGCSALGETDLMTYTIAANTLATNGDTLIFEAVFAYPGVSVGAVRPYFNGALIPDAGGPSEVYISSDGPLGGFLRFTITRLTASTALIQGHGGQPANGWDTFYEIRTGLDFAAAIIFKFTGEDLMTPPAANALIQKLLMGWYYPAN